MNISLFGIQLSLDAGSFITVAAMLCSFITVIAIVLPIIKRSEQKKAVQAAIRDERKKVFQQVMAESKVPVKVNQDEKEESSRAYLATFSSWNNSGVPVYAI